MHWKFDRHLSRDHDTGFESQLKEKHRRLRLNTAYRRTPTNKRAAIKSLRLDQPGHVGERAEHQSHMLNPTFLMEDDMEGEHNGTKSHLQMQLSDPGTETTTRNELLDQDSVSQSSNEIHV